MSLNSEILNSTTFQRCFIILQLPNNYYIITSIELVMWRAITSAHTALSGNLYTIEAITMHRHEWVCLTLSIHSVSRAEQRLGWFEVLWYAYIRRVVCGVFCFIAQYVTSPAWQVLFNSTPTTITVNGTRTQPFSTITHTNGTECNISSLRKPFSLPPHAASDTELSLCLPSLSPASLSLPPSFHISPWLLVDLSLCVSLSEKKRPPAVVPLECWVGEKYRLQANLFPFFLESLPCTYHFQVQHHTLESWQSAWGKTISAGLGVYLKMHFCSLLTCKHCCEIWKMEQIQIHSLS